LCSASNEIPNKFAIESVAFVAFVALVAVDDEEEEEVRPLAHMLGCREGKVKVVRSELKEEEEEEENESS